MTKSTYYHDGYRHAAYDRTPSPPDIPVLAAEYWKGYRDAKRNDERWLPCGNESFAVRWHVPDWAPVFLSFHKSFDAALRATRKRRAGAPTPIAMDETTARRLRTIRQRHYEIVEM